MGQLILIVLVVAVAASAQARVGLLSKVHGKVQIVRAGHIARDAHPADVISSGDRVITGANGGAVFLYFPDPQSARLTAGSEMLFTTSALTLRKGKLADGRKVRGCLLPSTLALSEASKQQVGMVETR